MKGPLSVNEMLFNRPCRSLYIHYLISRFKISNYTADVDLLLLNLNTRYTHLQYNYHKAKIEYNEDEKNNQKNLKISKIRVLIIIYRAFLLETDVPDIGLNRFHFPFKRERIFELFHSVR